MLANVIGGMQGMIDHIMVGHYVGYEGNAAIGVSTQLLIVVVSFIMSLFTGMSVLVARYVGAGESERVDRTVYQAFLTAVGLSALNILAGRVLALTTVEGSGVIVRLDVGGQVILARVTGRSAAALQLAPGVACFAILKTVALAQGEAKETVARLDKGRI